MKRLQGVRSSALLSTLVLVLLFAGCQTALNEPELEVQARHGLLEGIPVTGTLLDDPEDRTFEGTLTIEEITRDGRQLLISGVLAGTVNGEAVVQEFAGMELDLSTDGPGASCPILFLDIQPIFLDLLGLIVDLDRVTLEIRAERGPGRLLGNLLCALLGILDDGPLSAIDNLLRQINRLL